MAQHPRARLASGIARAVRGSVVDDQHELRRALVSERIEQAANHRAYAFFRLIGGDHETDLHSDAEYRNSARRTGVIEATSPGSAKSRGVDLFDEGTLADLKYRAKKQLRLRMRGLRAAYPEG